MNQIIQVQGMTCGHCEKAVTKAIMTLDPQAKVQIDRAKGWVQVQTDVNQTQVLEAIADEGYPAQAMATPG